MTDISKKSTRNKLQPRREPYWQRISKGCYLGYRVSIKEGGGTWIARLRDASGQQHYKALGNFDLFDEAKREGDRWFSHFGKTENRDFISVDDCCKAYIKEKNNRNESKSAKDSEGRFALYIYDSEFGAITLDKLRARHVRDWRDSIKASPATVNRNFSALIAALNFAHREGMVADNSAWVGVSKLKGDSGGNRRDRWLNALERRSLIDACNSDLSAFCEALLLSAARPGEIANCRVSDFSIETATLSVTGKTGSRVLPLSSSMLALCSAQAEKNHLHSSWLFSTSSGSKWTKNNWTRPFRLARESAGLGPEVVLYTLRHTSITEMIMAGVNAFTVAAFAGTSTKMIDEHYGHLCPNRITAEFNSMCIL